MSTSAVNATGTPRQHRPYIPRTSDAYTLIAVFEVKKWIPVEASVNWTDHEPFLGSTSRHAILADTAEERTANSTMQLILTAPCGCTASEVVGILRKEREPFTGLEVQADAEWRAKITSSIGCVS